LSNNESVSLAQDVRPVEVWAWAMYDFANSGYTTVVITAVFNAYFVSVVAHNEIWATFAWTAALAASYLLIMLTAPLLGAWADVHAAKKKLLLITTVGCVTFTAGLALVGSGDLWLAIALIIASNFFFGSGENLCAAFLPELARGEALGRVSGWGWSLGYIGGLLTLGICLVYVTRAQAGGATAAQFVPVTMLITAVIFALASLPTFAYLKERAVPQPGRQRLFAESLGRVIATWREASRYRDLARFLICIVFYQAGIQAVIVLAAIYAEQAMGFTTRQTLMLILVVNLTAAVGAFAFGHVQDRIGHLRALAVTLLGWVVTIVLAWAAQGPALFWIAANLVGLCLGSSQSAGRALIGYLSPEPKRAEFFGLWGLAVKFSAILGPLTYGLVSWLSRGDHRMAILFTGSYFLIGLGILTGVDVGRGRSTALAAGDKT
jgi:UMF1 family MFS transporter